MDYRRDCSLRVLDQKKWPGLRREEREEMKPGHFI
jgi:hypothetical protein